MKTIQNRVQYSVGILIAIATIPMIIVGILGVYSPVLVLYQPWVFRAVGAMGIIYTLTVFREKTNLDRYKDIGLAALPLFVIQLVPEIYLIGIEAFGLILIFNDRKQLVSDVPGVIRFFGFRKPNLPQVPDKLDGVSLKSAKRRNPYTSPGEVATPEPVIESTQTIDGAYVFPQEKEEEDKARPMDSPATKETTDDRQRKSKDRR